MLVTVLCRACCLWKPFDDDGGVFAFAAAAAAATVAAVSTTSSIPMTRNQRDPSALRTHFSRPFLSLSLVFPLANRTLTSPLLSSFSALVSLLLNAVAAWRDGRTKGAEREICKGKGVIGGGVWWSGCRWNCEVSVSEPVSGPDSDGAVVRV